MVSKKQKAAQMAAINPVLAAVAVATLASSYIYTTEAERASIDPSFITTNDALKDANGSLATKATDAGLAAYNASQNPTAAAPVAQAAPAQKFKIFKGVVLPPVKRGNKRTSEYDFDSLEVGDAFFVPASESNANPAKSLASTVSSASARYATEVAGKFVTRNVTVKDANGVKSKTQKQFPAKDYSRKFEIRALNDGKDYDMPGVKGALIARVI